MSDLIKRQDAIRVVREYMIDTQITDGDYHADGIEGELYELPSAEPVHKPCDSCQEFDCYGCKWKGEEE